MPKKSKPHRIDPANPQMNFVEAAKINHGEDRYDFFEYPYTPFTEQPRKASGYSHGIGQRAGKLRLSGKSNAHRIGKR